MKHVTYHIDDRELHFDVDGDCEVGAESVLLAEDDNIIAERSWNADGYTVDSFLADADYKAFREGVRQLLMEEIDAAGIPVDDSFTLERYHDTVTSDEDHAKFIARIRPCLPYERYPIDSSLVLDRISEICGVPLTFTARSGPTRWCLRIVRPSGKVDNNPPHRDVWLDRLRDAVNIYAPLAGSDQNSSLSVLPGSHLWKESEIERTAQGARIGGLTFTVPAVTGTLAAPFRMTRPDPDYNQVMVFSPYLVHGGSSNHNPDTTRVSLEMRFWRR